MARLDAKWYNFWGSGQAWYHFWQDTEAVGGASATSSPGTGSAVLTGFSPTISVTDNKTVSPGTGLLLFNGFAPGVSVTDNKTVSPITGQLILSGFVPTVVITVTPQPPQPSSSGGGGVWRSRRVPKDPEHDDDLIPIIRSFLDNVDIE